MKAVLLGGIDLGASSFKALTLTLDSKARLPLSEKDALDGLTARVTLDGRFGEAQARYAARTNRLVLDTTRLEALALEGTASRKGARWDAPVKLETGQILTDGGSFDGELKPVRATGIVRIEHGHIDSDSLTLTIPHGTAKATMRIDLARGAYVFNGNACLLYTSRCV